MARKTTVETRIIHEAVREAEATMGWPYYNDKRSNGRRIKCQVIVPPLWTDGDRDAFEAAVREKAQAANLTVVEFHFSWMLIVTFRYCTRDRLPQTDMDGSAFHGWCRWCTASAKELEQAYNDSTVPPGAPVYR